MTIVSPLVVQYQNRYQLQLYLPRHHLQLCSKLLFPSGPPSNLWNVYRPYILMLLHLCLSLVKVDIPHDNPHDIYAS